MIVRVKRRHIAAGDRGCSGSCPVALATKEAYKTESVHVNSDNISIDGRYKRLPLKVQAFIQNFDGQHANVKPFAFALSEGMHP